MRDIAVEDVDLVLRHVIRWMTGLLVMMGIFATIIIVTVVFLPTTNVRLALAFMILNMGPWTAHCIRTARREHLLRK